MIETYLCLKCGIISSSMQDKCFICAGETKLLPGIDWLDFIQSHQSRDERDALALTIQPKDQFDTMAWMHRQHVMRGWELHGKSWPKGYDYRYKEGVVNAECPYCHQYWTTKIGTGSRMISAGLFGLGSKKIGKQWHCHFCNSDF